MSRHLADHRAPSQGARVQQYLKLDRERGDEGAHPAVRAVIQRPRTAQDGNRRVVEFLRIARGREA